MDKKKSKRFDSRKSLNLKKVISDDLKDLKERLSPEDYDRIDIMTQSYWKDIIF